MIVKLQQRYFRIAVDHCQHVVEIMGHSSGKMPHGFHLLRLEQLRPNHVSRKQNAKEHKGNFNRVVFRRCPRLATLSCIVLIPILY
jgi:hypothetical protein